MKTNRQKTQQGFSLLEAVVALGVASVAVAAALSAFGGGLKSLGAADRRIDDVLFAEEKLMEAARLGLQEGVENGADARGLAWRREIRRYESDERATGEITLLPASANLKEVIVTIGEPEAPRVTLRTLVRSEAE